MSTEFSARTPAQIVAYLDNIILPCSRTELLRCAEDNEAPDSILDAIESLPNRFFVSVKDIIRAIAPPQAETVLITPKADAAVTPRSRAT